MEGGVKEGGVNTVSKDFMKKNMDPLPAPSPIIKPLGHDFLAQKGFFAFSKHHFCISYATRKVNQNT